MTNEEKKRALEIAKARTAATIEQIIRLEGERDAEKDGNRRTFIQATINSLRKEIGLERIEY